MVCALGNVTIEPLRVKCFLDELRINVPLARGMLGTALPSEVISAWQNECFGVLASDATSRRREASTWGKRARLRYRRQADCSNVLSEL